MKITPLQHSLVYALLTSALALVVTIPLQATSRITSNDPSPVYLAKNPLSSYTFWEECDPEYRAQFGLSFYRQSAKHGRGDPFFAGECDTTVAPTTTCTSSDCNCNKDIPLGDIRGRWNMVGLFYAEMNDNTNIQSLLIQSLDLTNSPGTGLTQQEIDDCIQEFVLPFNSDSTKRFGFFSVPIEYRKYGVRFEADIKTCWDLGLKIQTGVASIRQVAKFNDLTCEAANRTCADNCTIETFDCDCKKLVSNGIMEQKDVVAKTLGWNIDNFCESHIEDITLNFYWTRCFEFNATDEYQNDCWAHYTFAPYLCGHVSAPLDEPRAVDRLFSLPFGNNGHAGYGLDGGFTINFIETVQIGLEAGFTKFSSEQYCGFPVPTNDLQAGMFPRKANVCIEPGTNWTFRGTLGCYHFLDCLSGYVQFEHVNHCCDDITILETIPLTQEQLDLIGQTSDPFPVSNIRRKKMEDESKWNSSFVNVSFTYDIAPNMFLGFFWQAPVRQEFAYRPTTVMGTIAFNF